VILSRVVTSPYFQALPTYQWERLAVCCVLAVVLISSPARGMDSAIVLMSALAVHVTFQHVQIATRLHEADQARPDAHVECHAKLTEYLAIKEAAWIAVFLMTGAYPAIVGSLVLLAYPAWRRVYLRARRSS
jgi:hypothetical protein